MATTEPPDKQDRGRPRKRRYFRRRRRKGGQDASLAAEQRADSDDGRPGQRTRSKGQNRRSENRRRSSRRRGRATRGQESQAQRAEEQSQPQTEVYIYTHVIRPTYRDGGGGEYQADHSLNLAGATAIGPPVGMEYLLESIGRQLDEWFHPSADSTAEDGGNGEINEPDTDSTGGGEAREEGPGFGHEMADESTANEDPSLGGEGRQGTTTED